MSLKHVLLLSNEPATVSAVSAALQSNGKLAGDDVCRSMADLTSRLQRVHAPAALIDIDADNHGMLAEIEHLSRRFSDTRFVVLSKAIHNGLLLEAMKAGARHFLLKETIGLDLDNVLKRLCPDEGHGMRGAAVTVLSAGGGCGATTIAVNLAEELRNHGPGKEADSALVVDLDAYYGAVAAYLGVEGQYGLLDILSRPGAIDSHLIQSTAISHADGLHALISATRDRLGEPGPSDPLRLGAALEACKAAYRWTVIDAPRIPLTVAAELSRRSVVTFLLLQLTVKDIRTARQMLTTLTAQGVPSESIRVVATRYRKRRLLIKPEEARQALGLSEQQPLGILSNDYYAVAQAVNLGKPLARTSPRSTFRREVQRLAERIAETSAVPLPIGRVQVN